MAPSTSGQPQLRLRSTTDSGALLFVGLLYWLLLNFGASVSFAFAAIASHVQMTRHHAWCAWTTVLAGPLLAYGTLSRKFAGFDIWGHSEYNATAAPTSWIDVGALCLAQAAFIAFVRLAYFMRPPGHGDGLDKMSRYVQVGYVLLCVNGLVALFWFWPVQRYYAPLLALPFCVYFLGLHLAWKRQLNEWAVLQKPTALSLEPASTYPWTDLFHATLRISIIMTIRSVAGIWAAYTGRFHNSDMYTLIADDVLLLLCYWIFCRSHPGRYLPRSYTVVLYHDQQEKSKYELVSSQIPVDSALGSV